MGKNNTPATCVRCMGRGTISETKEGWGADEKGLPVWTRQTTIVACPDCGGTGSK